MKVIQYLGLKDDGVDSMAEMMFWHLNGCSALSSNPSGG
jgi:hypothetical protein